MPATNPNFFVPTPHLIKFQDSADPLHAFYRLELVPTRLKTDFNPPGSLDIDQAKRREGDVVRPGTGGSGTWTLDSSQQSPWITNEFANNYEFIELLGSPPVSQSANPFPILSNTSNVLTVTGTPTGDKGWIRAKIITLLSSTGFAAGSAYGFVPGCRVMQGVAIEGDTTTSAFVYGVGAMATHPWNPDKWNIGGGSWEDRKYRYLLVDSDGNLYKITDTVIPSVIDFSDIAAAVLTLDPAPGVSVIPTDGPALIVSGGGYFEYNGTFTDPPDTGLASVTMLQTPVANGATVMETLFLSLQIRTTSYQVNWLGHMNIDPSVKLVMTKRFKAVDALGNSSDWTGEFVDATPPDLTPPPDPLPSQLVYDPTYGIPAENLNIIPPTEISFRLEDYPQPADIWHYIWHFVPEGMTIEDVNAIITDAGGVDYTPSYGGNLDIYLSIEDRSGNINSGGNVLMLSLDIYWLDPSAFTEEDEGITVLDGDPDEDTPGVTYPTVADFSNLVEPLVSDNFDGDPLDILASPGLVGSAWNPTDGRAVFNDIVLRGTIFANAGEIASYTILTTYMYSLLSGTPTSSPVNGIVIEGGAQARISVYDAVERTRMGYLSPGIYGIQVRDSGSNIIFEASDTRQVLAGWDFDDTMLSAANISFLSGANPLITVGADVDWKIEIGGTAGSEYIGSSTFTSGPLGTGWKIDSTTGRAVFQDIVARGKLSMAVFEYQTISAVGGLLMVSGADVISVDMTAADASTLTIDGDVTFAVDDILRIKDGVDDEWLRVTNIDSAPQYTVTRDWAGSYGANANPRWKKGTAVVSTGGTGSGPAGFILLDSASANSPYMDIVLRTAVGYDQLTTKVRIGNLDGIGDTDFGIAPSGYGLYTDNVFLKGSITTTAPGGQRISINEYEDDAFNNAILLYDSGGTEVLRIDDNITGSIPGISIGSTPTHITWLLPGQIYCRTDTSDKAGHFTITTNDNLVAKGVESFATISGIVSNAKYALWGFSAILNVSATADAYGVYGRGGAAVGNAYGIYGTATSVSGTAWAGYFNDGDVYIKETLKIDDIAAGVSDYDKFLVSDGGIIKYRTGAQVLSDIGVVEYTDAEAISAVEGEATLDLTGILTGTSQPSFLAYDTGDHAFAPGSWVPLEFNATVFDEGGNFNTTTYTFTAPVDGKYLLHAIFYINTIDTDAVGYFCRIDVSNHREHRAVAAPKFTVDPTSQSVSLTIIAEMDANDTASVDINQSGGVTQSILRGGSSPMYSCFSGWLLG